MRVPCSSEMSMKFPSESVANGLRSLESLELSSYRLMGEMPFSLGSRSSGVYAVLLHLASVLQSTVCRNGKKPTLGRFRGAR